MPDRNPYLILGLPFGASREQANIAFARRARSLRRAGAAGRDQLTELTWALNQIDEATADPDAVLDLYRIPSHPAALNGTGPGVLAPPPEPLPPRGGDRDRAYRRLRAAAGQEFLRYLVLLRAAQVGPPTP